ncbi:hypothetical protein GCM10010270_79330 [Streptomyces violaceus]|nr:hypothetical protein GCM10010270_79330 [Streptomyces janthinus]
MLGSPQAEAVTLIEDRTRAATAPARIRFLITALEIRAVEGRPGGFARLFTPVDEPGERFGHWSRDVSVAEQ